MVSNPGHDFLGLKPRNADGSQPSIVVPELLDQPEPQLIDEIEPSEIVDEDKKKVLNSYFDDIVDPEAPSPNDEYFVSPDAIREGEEWDSYFTGNSTDEVAHATYLTEETESFS